MNTNQPLNGKQLPLSSNTQTSIKLHEPSYGEEEIEAVVEVMRSTNVTSGTKVKQMEALFGENAVMCNSGSSANLLAIATLCNPLQASPLKPGDEVIVSALSWSTTVWPLVQFGLVPVIVDIDPDTLNIDTNKIEEAISPKTKAIMPVHVYGNPCEMMAINYLCEKHNLILIEDCCEALGASVGMDGRMSTYSFYFSHHITTLEGGMVVCKDERDADIMRCLRAHGWIREMKNPPKYENFDPKFVFITDGYNLRASDVNAAMGILQMRKLPTFVDSRRATAEMLADVFSNYPVRMQLDMGSSWFGFPLVYENANDLRQYFEKNGIETRPLICGNIAKQPGMSLYPHRVSGDLKNADEIMANGFSIGCHQSMTEGDVAYIEAVAEEYFKCAS